MVEGVEGRGPGTELLLGGVACGGRRTCCPFDLDCEECPGTRGVPASEAPERAGEDRGVALEAGGREAGLWRPPPALGRLLAAALGSTVLRSGALPTDFLRASFGGRGRALGAARGRSTSAPAARDRREMAGEEVPGGGPGKSGDKAEGRTVTDLSRLMPLTAQEPRSSPGRLPLRAAALRALLLGASGAFPLAAASSAWGRSPFCPRGPPLGTGGNALRAEPPPLLPLPSLHYPVCEMRHMGSCGPLMAFHWRPLTCKGSHAPIQVQN